MQARERKDWKRTWRWKEKKLNMKEESCSYKGSRNPDSSDRVVALWVKEQSQTQREIREQAAEHSKRVRLSYSMNGVVFFLLPYLPLSLCVLCLTNAVCTWTGNTIGYINDLLFKFLVNYSKLVARNFTHLLMHIFVFVALFCKQITS